MPRQMKNSRSRLEVSAQTTPSLSRHREVATSPIRMAENKEFHENVNGDDDSVNGGDANNVNEDAAAHVLQLPELVIPDGVDAATANLLKMQMNMMQTLMNNQMAQVAKRFDYET
jgi:hypothetical protein